MRAISSRWLRRAEASKGLLVALAVVAVAAVGFWSWKLLSKDKAEKNANAAEREYTYACSECKATGTMKYSQTKTVPQNDEGQYQCPKCGKFKARFYRPGSSVLSPVSSGKSGGG